MSKWNTVLTDCSLKPMKLIVEKRKSAHIKLKTDLDSLTIELSTFKEHSEYTSLNKQVETKIKQLETDIIEV